ncbi:MAG: hypothetical protein KF793_11135 [Nitrospira sp.]|nr:hypothetical protein [Nitrospira sp.]
MSFHINANLREHIGYTFEPLKTQAAAKSFPPPESLSKSVEKWLKKRSGEPVDLEPENVKLFATAAVDMWLRAVHSFLISASLTKASPIWSSVGAYYASHYCVRAFAHLLGHFQSFRVKKIARLEFDGKRGKCSFRSKQGGDREHQFYWKLIKEAPSFSADPLFKNNLEESDSVISEIKHRDLANYCDHLSALIPKFAPLSEAILRDRIAFISSMHFDSPPSPQKGKFPDVEAIQILAYHRIVRFRNFVNEALGDSNRFWKVHRNPAWTAGLTNFQLIEQGGIGSISSRS